MINKIIWSLVGLTLLGGALPVLAINDQFTVGVYVSDDTTSPTTPAPVTATPASASQIDVTWGASVDNDTVGGYRVYRDATPIATTTLTSYSDTGLTATTTYSYTIQAFDLYGNYSSTSLAATTTTLPAPPPATTSTQTNNEGTEIATQLTPKLTSFTLTPETDQALFSFTTNLYVRYELRWGKTVNYELGAVQSQLFGRSHLTKITDLEPGTRYQYELKVYTQNGSVYVLKHDSFTTSAAADLTAPANVSNLKAVAAGTDVLLSWINPTDSDFAYVRVVRSYHFFPLDPSAGYIAYQGRATDYRDLDALADSQVLYYTVFTYDQAGNISSGASVLVYRQNQTGETVTAIPGANTTSSEASSTPGLDWLDQPPPPLVAQYDLDFRALSFSQGGQSLERNADTFTGGNLESTLVYLPLEAAPPHPKAILLALGATTDQSEQTFLLRINKDGSGYEALIPRLRVGEYPVILTIFDYKTNIISQARGGLRIVATPISPLVTEWSISRCWWLIFIPLLLWYLILRLRRFIR